MNLTFNIVPAISASAFFFFFFLGLGTVLLLELDTLGLMLKWGPQNAEEIPQGSQGFVNLLLNCRGNVLAMDFSSTPISHISFLSKKGHIDYAVS